MTREQLKQVFPHIDESSLVKLVHTEGIIETLTVKDLKAVLVGHFEKDLMSQQDQTVVDQNHLERIVASKRFEQILFKLFFEVRDAYEMALAKISIEPLDEMIQDILDTDELHLTTSLRDISKSFYELSEAPFLQNQVYEVTYHLAPEVYFMTKVTAALDIQMTSKEIISKAKQQLDALPLSKNSIEMYDDQLFSIRELTTVAGGQPNA